jgi:hypothetical protein
MLNIVTAVRNIARILFIIWSLLQLCFIVISVNITEKFNLFNEKSKTQAAKALEDAEND